MTPHATPIPAVYPGACLPETASAFGPGTFQATNPGRCAPDPLPGGSRFMPRATWPVVNLAVGAVIRRGDRASASGPSAWSVCLSAPVRRVVSARRGNPGVAQ